MKYIISGGEFNALETVSEVHVGDILRFEGRNYRVTLRFWECQRATDQRNVTFAGTETPTPTLEVELVEVTQ